MKDHHMHHDHHHRHDDSLSGLLGRCGHFLAHRIGGKKRGQEGVLSIIAQRSGITQKELTEVLGIQPASVSELLMKLEHKGLVRREKNEQDRRSVCVFLTEEGQFLLQQSNAVEAADQFEALTVEEKEQLRFLLQKLLTHWEQNYPMDHRHHEHKHKKHDL